MTTFFTLDSWLTKYVEDVALGFDYLRSALRDQPPDGAVSSLKKIRSKYGYTAVQVAAWKNDPGVLHLLFSILGNKVLDLVFETVQEATALHIATVKGNTNCIQALLKPMSQKDRLRLVMKQDGVGRTALMEAAAQGNTRNMEVLLHQFDEERRYEILQL